MGWKPTKKEGPFGVATAYEWPEKGAKLYKKGKHWFLNYKGKDHPMPKRKASFDHAEGLLKKLMRESMYDLADG
jgi:hypothetical protein